MRHMQSGIVVVLWMYHNTHGPFLKGSRRRSRCAVVRLWCYTTQPYSVTPWVYDAFIETATLSMTNKNVLEFIVSKYSGESPETQLLHVILSTGASQRKSFAV